MSDTEYTPSSVDAGDKQGRYWDEQFFASIPRERKEWTARLSWFFKEEGLVVWLSCDPETQMKGMVLIKEAPKAEEWQWAKVRRWLNYNPTSLDCAKTKDGGDRYALSNLLTDEGMRWLVTRPVYFRQEFLILFKGWQ